MACLGCAGVGARGCGSANVACYQRGKVEKGEAAPESEQIVSDFPFNFIDVLKRMGLGSISLALSYSVVLESGLFHSRIRRGVLIETKMHLPLISEILRQWLLQEAEIKQPSQRL